jgi:hypothetical protein
MIPIGGLRLRSVTGGNLSIHVIPTNAEESRLLDFSTALGMTIVKLIFCRS